MPPSRPKYDPRSELDELDWRDPESRRPPTGQDWAAVPVTVKDMLAQARMVTQIATEQTQANARIKVIEDALAADRSGELAQARQRVMELEIGERRRHEEAAAEEKRKQEAAAALELGQAIERAKDRRARIWQVVILVLGAALGILANHFGKLW